MYVRPIRNSNLPVCVCIVYAYKIMCNNFELGI